MFGLGTVAFPLVYWFASPQTMQEEFLILELLGLILPAAQPKVLQATAIKQEWLTASMEAVVDLHGTCTTSGTPNRWLRHPGLHASVKDVPDLGKGS